MFKQFYILFFFLNVFSVFTISENSFITDFPKVIRFWDNNAKMDTFVSFDGTEIAYSVLKRSKIQKSDTAIVVITGYSESMLKYRELVYDLRETNADFYLMDHRGMGLSERKLEAKSRVFINSFNEYVKDLEKYLYDIADIKSYKNKILIAHSMGGGVSTYFLIDNPDVFDCAILSAPMYEIKAGFLPKWFVKIITASRIKFGGQFELANKPNKKEENLFEHNRVTSSEIRWNIWQGENGIVKNNDTLYVEGATNNWLYECIQGLEYIRENAEKLKTPVLLLQAGNDTFVHNRAHNYIKEQSQKIQIKYFKDSKHEILMEQDYIRDDALSSIISFIKKNEK